MYPKDELLTEICCIKQCLEGFPGGSVVKNLPAMQETWIQSLGQEDHWRRAQQPTPAFLPGESHGQKNLLGYSPWGHKEWTRLK